MVTYAKRAVRGTLIVFINLLIAAFFWYLIRIILARSLTTSEFGLFYAIHTLVLFFIFFRSLGSNVALIRYIPEFKMKKKFGEIKSAIIASLMIQTIISILFIILIYFLSEFLSNYYFKSSLASALLKIFSFYFLLSIPFYLIKDILRGFQKIKAFSFVDTAHNLFVLVITGFLIFLGFGIFGPVIAFLVGAVLVFLTFIIITNRTFNILKYKSKNFLNTAKKMLLFGLPVMLSGAGDRIIGYFDVLMLTYYTTLEKVGIYNVALPLALMLSVIGYAISWVLYPMVSELSAKKDEKRLKIGLDFLYRYLFVIIIPIALGAFAFTDLLIKLFFTEAYLPGATAFKILLIGVALYIVARVNFNFITGIGKPKTVTKIIAVSALLNVILNFLLIPKFGIEGAALATTISYSIGLVFSINRVSKFAKYKVPWFLWLKTLLSGLIFLGIILILKRTVAVNIWIKLIALVVATLVYILLTYLLKVININEIKKFLGA